MKGRRRRGKGDQRFWLAAVIMMTAILVLVLVAVTWRIVMIARLSAAVTEVADTTLGESPTTATIVAARRAILDLARERGVRRPLLLIALVLAASDSHGQPSHVVCFELCAAASHPTYERDLGRLLGPDELDALGREEICEARSPRWGHQHH